MLKNPAIAFIALTLASCAALEQEIDIELADVPQNILSAAQGAVEGIVLESAEIEVENGIKVYEFEGTSNGVEYEIEVSESGKILEVETVEDDD